MSSLIRHSVYTYSRISIHTSVIICTHDCFLYKMDDLAIGHQMSLKKYNCLSIMFKVVQHMFFSMATCTFEFIPIVQRRHVWFVDNWWVMTYMVLTNQNCKTVSNWLIDWGLTPFSIMFQSYHGGQSTYSYVGIRMIGCIQKG